MIEFIAAKRIWFVIKIELAYGYHFRLYNMIYRKLTILEYVCGIIVLKTFLMYYISGNSNKDSVFYAALMG